MNRSEKEGQVEQLRDYINGASLVVVTRQVGLTVEEATNLRRSMRAAGAEYKVFKNTLADIAVKGTKAEGIGALLKGPTALALSADPLAAAKAAVTFANTNNKFEVIGGAMDGKTLSAQEVKALATLPSLDELRAKLLGLLNAPATKLAILLKEPAARLARVSLARGQA
jgi:large subunit ribosomal protein L10